MFNVVGEYLVLIVVIVVFVEECDGVVLVEKCVEILRDLVCCFQQLMIVLSEIGCDLVQGVQCIDCGVVESNIDQKVNQCVWYGFKGVFGCYSLQFGDMFFKIFFVVEEGEVVR